MALAGGGFVVVDILFSVATIVLWGVVYGPCFVFAVHSIVSSFQTSRWGRERDIHLSKASSFGVWKRAWKMTYSTNPLKPSVPE